VIGYRTLLEDLGTTSTVLSAELSEAFWSEAQPLLSAS